MHWTVAVYGWWRCRRGHHIELTDDPPLELGDRRYTILTCLRCGRARRL
ncbi:MAG TPA: hypothetical protein VGA69_00865 [Nitriliruptorales bacterium]